MNDADISKLIKLIKILFAVLLVVQMWSAFPGTIYLSFDKIPFPAGTEVETRQIKEIDNDYLFKIPEDFSSFPLNPEITPQTQKVNKSKVVNFLTGIKNSKAGSNTTILEKFYRNYQYITGTSEGFFPGVPFVFHSPDSFTFDNRHNYNDYYPHTYGFPIPIPVFEIFDDKSKALEFALYALNEMEILPKNYEVTIFRNKDPHLGYAKNYQITFYPSINEIPVKSVERADDVWHQVHKEKNYCIKIEFNQFGIVYLYYNWLEISLSNNFSTTVPSNNARALPWTPELDKLINTTYESLFNPILFLDENFQLSEWYEAYFFESHNPTGDGGGTFFQYAVNPKTSEIFRYSSFSK